MCQTMHSWGLAKKWRRQKEKEGEKLLGTNPTVKNVPHIPINSIQSIYHLTSRLTAKLYMFFHVY